MFFLALPKPVCPVSVAGLLPSVTLGAQPNGTRRLLGVWRADRYARSWPFEGTRATSCHWWQCLGSWRADRYARPWPFEGPGATHLPLVAGFVFLTIGMTAVSRRAGAARRSRKHPQCEEEGLWCNPSSSDVLAADEVVVAGLGGWRACLPTSSGGARKHTTNSQQVASSSRYMPRCSATIQMHQKKIPNCALRKRQLTCTSNVDHQGEIAT